MFACLAVNIDITLSAPLLMLLRGHYKIIGKWVHSPQSREIRLLKQHAFIVTLLFLWISYAAQHCERYRRMMFFSFLPLRI